MFPIVKPNYGNKLFRKKWKMIFITTNLAQVFEKASVLSFNVRTKRDYTLGDLNFMKPLNNFRTVLKSVNIIKYTSKTKEVKHWQKFSVRKLENV